jgi:hypothetical protein
MLTPAGQDSTRTIQPSQRSCADLPPPPPPAPNAGAKFGWCGFAGRDNLALDVNSSAKVFVAAAAPSWITNSVRASASAGPPLELLLLLLQRRLSVAGKPCSHVAAGCRLQGLVPGFPARQLLARQPG